MRDVSVLIVEDDKWLAEQHQRVLNLAGFRTMAVLHAPAAIQAIDNFKPDVIILDVLLTGSTAFALLHELQSYGDTGNIPIILCTNLANDMSLDDLKCYGVRHMIDKTKMLPSDLITAVKSVVV